MTIHKILSRTSKFLDRIAIVLMTTYMAVVTVLVIISVFFRFIGKALSWSEELSRWLLIGIAYIGASCALKRKGLIGITGVVMKLPYKPRTIVYVLGNIITLVLLYYMIRYGFEVAIDGISQTGAVILVPMIYVKMNLPLGALIMLVHILSQSLDLLSEFKSPASSVNKDDSIDTRETDQ